MESENATADCKGENWANTPTDPPFDPIIMIAQKNGESELFLARTNYLLYALIDMDGNRGGDYYDPDVGDYI